MLKSLHNSENQEKQCPLSGSKDVKNLIAVIFNNVQLSEEDLELLTSKLERIELKKGLSLLKEGDKVTNQYYVVNGCLRTYFVDDSGKEHTVQFAIHDWWISDYTAFFADGIAILTIETLQDSLLFRMSKTDMDLLLKQIPALETFFRKKMEGAFAGFQKRILSNLAESATERYIHFIESYPNIEQQVKNYHIASYLGITTESLSRIRKELFEN